MIDDNVFYKDSVMLAQRLIELRKDKWELASYPLERHGLRARRTAGTTSTAASTSCSRRR